MKIVVAGDYSPHNRAAEMLDSGNYAAVFDQVKPIVDSADYSIVNFETTVASDKDTPITKIGPNLFCSKNAVQALRYVGFDCVTLANNHFRDYGDVGVDNSLNLFEEIGLDYVGGGRNIDDAQKVLYKEIKGATLAIVNVCESEFNIASDISGGSAPLDLIAIYRNILQAKEKSNYILVIVHGGHEKYQLPSPRMQNTYRWFIDIGADAVVNHHQHCMSGYEVYDNKPIFYGLGNFCFDLENKTASNWNYGYMVELNLESDNVGFTLYPYIQYHQTPAISPIDNNEIAADLAKLNAIILDSTLLKSEFEKLCRSKYDWLDHVLQPYHSRLLRKFYNLGLLPSFLSVRVKRLLYDYVACNAHRDVFKSFLAEEKK